MYGFETRTFETSDGGLSLVTHVKFGCSYKLKGSFVEEKISGVFVPGPESPILSQISFNSRAV